MSYGFDIEPEDPQPRPRDPQPRPDWDQTPQDWIDLSHETDPGTGIYALGGRKIFVPDLTRDQFTDFGGNADNAGILQAGKWVPHKVQQPEHLIATPCGEPCHPQTGCLSPGCLCVNNVCT